MRNFPSRTGALALAILFVLAVAGVSLATLPSEPGPIGIPDCPVTEEV